MRRTLALFSLACISPVLASGCFSASSGGGSPDANFTQPDGEAFDSSMNEPDASVDSSTPDVTVEAAMPDAAIDSAVHEAEAGPSPVVVNVTSASGPENGVVVVFQDASGNIVSSTSTTGGVASFLAAAGSQVTVVMGTAVIPYLVTIQGIAPGDVLAVYDPTSDLSYVGDQVNVAAVSNQPEASSYTVDLGGVGSASTSANFPIVATAGPGSAVNGQVSVLVTANSVMTGGNEYTWQNGLALSDAGAADAAITNPWTSAIATVDMAGTLPDSAALLYGTAQLEMIAGGVPFGVAGGTTSQYISQPDAGLSATFSYPVGFASGVQLETGLHNTTYPNVGLSTAATRSAQGADASIAVDYGQLLPPLASATLDTTNPVQPVVTWSPNDAGVLASTDGIVVSILWEAGSNNRMNGVWTFVAPPTSTQVQVPLLPTGVAAFATDGGAYFVQVPIVAYVQTSFVTGYAGLRAQAGTAGLTSLMVAADQSNSGGYSGGSVVPPLPADGTLQLSAVTRAGD